MKVARERTTQVIENAIALFARDRDESEHLRKVFAVVHADGRLAGLDDAGSAIARGMGQLHPELESEELTHEGSAP